MCRSWKIGATSHQPCDQASTRTFNKGGNYYLVYRLLRRLNEVMHIGYWAHSKHSINVSCCLPLGYQILSKHLYYLPWMLCGSLICLLRTVLHSVSIFSKSILCYQLYSSPNHSKLSFCFSRLRKIQILFPNYRLRYPFWAWFF